jgi:hypothetical protein
MIGKRHDRSAHRWATTKIKRTARSVMTTIKPWRTIAVVPLAGTWCNRFRTNDGKAINDPAPAILIQERGGETRTCFSTYYRGVLLPAIDIPGYEESSCIAGTRTNPHRPGKPPWELLDEPDPVRKAAEEAAAVGNSFVVKNCDNFTT